MTINNKNKGFTLIELLVVIALVSLLASVVVLALKTARAKARDTRRVADISQIAKALEIYRNNIGSYPLSLIPENAITGISPDYLSGYPKPPSPPDGDCTVERNKYYYQSNGSTYGLFFCTSTKIGDIKSGYKYYYLGNTFLRYDTNDDGVIDSHDILNISQSMSPVNNYNCPIEKCDINGDGVIDQRDVVAMAQRDFPY